jgi:SNF2 family DNA or RNA helicase
MQLRKASNHPYLFMEPSDRARANSEMVESCGKMQLFHRLLARLKERGHHVLVFSQMSRMLDIIEDYLVLQKHSYCRIDGSVASEDRASQIADFNVKGSSIFAFLLSTRAGGLGINLWSADTCIIFDSDWNPQADLQAMDRCHRIGQTKPVCVYRLITRNSVEVKILEKAQSKRQLELLVVADGRFMDVDKKSSSKNLSSDDVNDILAAAKKMMDASGQGQSEAITDEQLDAALDRSDMMPGASGAAPAGKKKKAAAVKAGGFEILE